MIIKNEKGITLVALVVTCIVLIILAGITITTAVGDHDKAVVSKAYEVRDETEIAAQGEDEVVKEILNEINDTSNESNKYTVTFVDGDNNILTTITKTSGNEVTYPSSAPTPTKSSTEYATYIFSGEWATDAEGTDIVDLSSITSSDTLYAVFTETAITYTVTFKDYDGTTLKAVSVNSGETATYPTSNPTRTGYTFSKWVTTSGGSTEATLTNITASKTVYASYTINTYTVTFSYKDSSGTTVTSTATVNYGSDVASSDIPSPETYTSGSYTYTFSKWVTTSGGSTTATLTSITANKTVYASYTKTTSSSGGTTHSGGSG